MSSEELERLDEENEVVGILSDEAVEMIEEDLKQQGRW